MHRYGHTLIQRNCRYVADPLVSCVLLYIWYEVTTNIKLAYYNTYAFYAPEGFFLRILSNMV